MSIFYEEIALSSTQNQSCAMGLYHIIIQIGKNEYNKKLYSALRNGKTYFNFPTCVRPHKAILCSTDGNTYVEEAYYYSEGISKINKLVRRGKKNKTAIKRLVKAQNKNYKILNDEYNNYNVFFIHRISSSYILEAIYNYIREDLCQRSNCITPEIFLTEIVNSNRNFFLPYPVNGSEILTKPYNTQLKMRDFYGKNRIIKYLDLYDRLIPGGINE